MQKWARKWLGVFFIAVGSLLGWIYTAAGDPAPLIALVFLTAGLIHQLLYVLAIRGNERLPTHAVNYAIDAEQWSHDMAELAADALVDAKLISQRDRSRCREIIGEEIAVRLDLGDLPPSSPADSSNFSGGP